MITEIQFIILRKIGDLQMTLYEIISIVISILALITSIISATSILFLYKQIKIETVSYDASREENIREKTVSVIYNWTSEVRKETRLVEDLVSKFNESECWSIYNFTAFCVDKETYYEILQICLLDDYEMINNLYKSSSQKDDNKYEISGFILSELRWQITSYLNSLEVVAISWQQGLVDRNVLIDQFSFLACNGRNAMENYRKIAGNGASYPALEVFCKEINKQNSLKHGSAQPKSEIKRN